MAITGLGLVERRSVMVAASEAMVGFGEVVHEASDAELAVVMGEADALAATAEAVRAQVVVEAVRRGVVAQAGMNPHGWVREFAPSLRQGGAGQVARLATQVAGAGRAGGSLAPDAAAEPDPGSALGLVWAGVRDAAVSPSLGLSVLGEVARLEPRLVPEAVPSVVEALLGLGSRWGSGQMRRLRPAMLARFGAAGELDDLQERLVPVARLSQPWVASGDVTQYQLVVTPEQAAVLEAAIGPLSAPAPNQETGERDLRPAGQRRVEALAEVCRRSSAVDADAQGGDGAAGSAAALHVTIALSDLQEMTGAGEVIGSTATGTLLSPGVLRRVACDAALVPHVLGTAGEDLDLGRVVRLFTRAQRRRLWRRDRCCTFPGCAAPGSWTRAHHVLHWADGGLSDVDNAALLCQRHHTVVHTRRLWASVRARPDELGRYVVWDLSVGSYDRQLDQLRRDRAGQDPPPLTRQRLLDLVASVTSDAEADRRLAQHDLDRLSDAWQQWQHQLDTAV
ncbi:MAG: DUF222 domain-containing protein, partial [Ornithinibacter sp.]